MRLLSLLVAACALVSGSAAARTRRQSGPSACQDFAKRNGTCGIIQDCPPLYRLVANGRRPTGEEISNLRRSQCGERGRRLLVCCATESGDGPFTGPPEQHPNRAVLESGKACGLNFAGRIIGGTEVPLGKFPWVALLGYTEAPSEEVRYECGGTLIGRQYVLTAAHCVSGLPFGFQLKTVRLGEHDLSQPIDCQNSATGERVCNVPPQDFTVVKAIVHEDYDVPARFMNDIALLKLDRPVIEGNFVSKVCLPFGDVGRQNFTGVNLTVAGFGRTGPTVVSSKSDVLLEVRVPGVDQEACGDTVRQLNGTLGPQQICVGGETGRDSCRGDSGGPLVWSAVSGPPYSLIGVVSFGFIHCGFPGVPSVNTRVSEYLNWILDRVDG
ncbi:CLIP domain-containing serine protease 14D-like [Pollicipes pollicipes]|uniref:CLIP domain-containing serine protease 14D-like n=1 Tax=Pollicipes pollicipes TaxID=41117 RepID=UPI001884CABE|nr:CLIP domain-containing serine protease 14D-like [Pollicipes pollicipes]